MKRNTQILAVYMVVIITCCTIVNFSSAQGISCTDGANVTQNDGVSVSGTTEQTANPPAAIVDNNAADSSRWSVKNFPTTGIIDLQSIYRIDGMELFPYQDRAYQYTIEVSDDGTNYTQVVNRSSNTNGGDSFADTFTAIDARYVKLTVLGCNCSTPWSSITELKVYCASSPGDPVCGSISGGPTDNPVEAAYPGEYGWTSNINWECVYNVDDYAGNATQKFNAAQTDAYNDGGGVVYFPAGSYTFTDDLLVKSGVVIRGATPANNNAMSGTFDPPTNFEFPAYNFTESGSGTDNSTALNLYVWKLLMLLATLV